ncbi:MAG: hypothetical protein ACI4RR_09165 [Eubacterium sp.]
MKWRTENMTSQKFSADKHSAKYDFKYALKTIAFPSVVSFAASAFFFVFAVVATISNYCGGSGLSPEAKITTLRNQFSVILTANPSTPLMGTYLSIGITAIIIGVLFALFSFGFLMKKKSVNVFLSSGVDRKTMFKNRVLASIIMMAVTSIVPIIIDVVINIYFFSHPSYMLVSGMWMFLCYFAYMLVGFSMMSISMTLCATIVESMFFGAGIIWLPTVLLVSIDALLSAFLRGFDVAFFSFDEGVKSILGRTSIINPLFFGARLDSNTVYLNLFAFLCRARAPEKEGSDTFYYTNFWGGTGYKEVGVGYIIPILIWLALSVLFLFVAKKLLLNRRAEIAGIHSSVPFVANFFAVEVVLLACSSFIGVVSDSEMPRWNMIWIVPIAFIVYYVILSVNKRSVKHTNKSALCPIASLTLIMAVSLVFGSGLFGYTSYVPEISEIEYVTVTSKNTAITGTDINSTDSFSGVFQSDYNSNLMGIFTDSEDLKKVCEVHSQAADRTDDMAEDIVKFHYVLKNGKVVDRYFKSVDRQVPYSILTLTDTRAYRQELEFFMSSKYADEKESGYSKYYDDLWNCGMAGGMTSQEEIKKLFHEGSAYLLASDGVTESKIGNTPELLDAILADRLSMTCEQKYLSDKKALGAISFVDIRESGGYYDEYTGEYIEYEDSYYTPCTIRIYINEYMTNTLSYLRSTGEYDLLSATDDDGMKLVWASYDKVKNLRNNSSVYGYPSEKYLSNNFITMSNVFQNSEGEDMKKLFEKSQSTKDEAQMKQLYDSSLIFRYAKQDDYIVMFKYRNGDDTKYVSRIITKENVPSFVK